jgi:outer membrane protein
MNRLIILILTLILVSPIGVPAAEPVKSAPSANVSPINAPGAVKTPDGADMGIIKKGEKLTLGRCIEIALIRQPSMLASMYTVDSYQSRIGQAQSGYFPQVSLSGEYNRIKALASSTSSASTGKAYDQYVGTAALTQLIYDFGKTPTQVGIARLNLEASRSDLETTRATTIQTVKQSYYGLLKAQRNLEVAGENVRQYTHHLEQAKGFFEVGTKPKYDVTKAEVDLSNAKLNLITADNALRIAKVTLNNSMGLPEAADYLIEDSLGHIKKNLTLRQAIDTAMQNRPEIIATGHRVKASEENISLAQKGFFPVISGSAAYNRGSFNEMTFRNDGWNAGVAVSFPIFSGFLTHHQVKEAEATYNATKANYELLKQNVILEVEQAYLNLVAAEDRIPTSELAQRQATENLEIANGRYEAGVGNPIEVTDAQVSYSSAKTTYIQALYDYNVAIANLDKSMGLK